MWAPVRAEVPESVGARAAPVVDVAAAAAAEV